MPKKHRIGLGIIGAGYISNAHALALKSVSGIMGMDVDIHFQAVSSEVSAECESFSSRFNCVKSYQDWRDLIDDPLVNAIVIGTPPVFHFEQAKAAIQAGKHVLCEKPIAMNAKECRLLYELASRHRVHHAVGLTYLANPAMFLARELINEKRLGDLYSFVAHFNEDHLCDPDSPFHWHCDKEIAGYGTTADLGYHVIGNLLFLLGMPSSLISLRQVVVQERRVQSGRGVRSVTVEDSETGKESAKTEMRQVTSDDMANVILKYSGDFAGVMQVSRVATGRDQFVHIEINGSKGSIHLDMEDMNSIDVYLRSEEKSLEGFKKVIVGPQHKKYAHFCPAPGHGLGFNDLLVIQDAGFIHSIINDKNEAIADLKFGANVHNVIDAIAQASDEEKWVSIKKQL